MTAKGATRWRFGTWNFLATTAMVIVSCGFVVAALFALRAESPSEAVISSALGLVSLAIAARLVGWRRRNYVETSDGKLRIVLVGRRVNESNDIVVLLPAKPGVFPSVARCQVGNQVMRLPMIGQNKLWQPPALRRFTKTLDEIGVGYEWF